jgi:hypothetical protein
MKEEASGTLALSVFLVIDSGNGFCFLLMADPGLNIFSNLFIINYEI